MEFPLTGGIVNGGDGPSEQLDPSSFNQLLKGVLVGAQLYVR